MSLERLRSERNLWMATVRPDGWPHIAPLWFVYVDERIWIGTGRSSVRVRNLRAQHSASICLEDGNEPVVAEGTVLIHESLRPAAVVEAFASKYEWDITAAEDDDLGQVALLEFSPHRWLFGLKLPVIESRPDAG